MKSKGLGDTIEKITKATGIKKVVDTVNKVMKKDCGCDKRKDNALIQYPTDVNRTGNFGIAALASKRINLSPFTKGCRDTGASMRIHCNFLRGSGPNTEALVLLVGYFRSTGGI